MHPTSTVNIRSHDSILDSYGVPPIATSPPHRVLLLKLSGVRLVLCGVGQFINIGHPNFFRVKVEEDPQGFLDEIEKIFPAMQATNDEGVKFVAYYLKDIAYKWYKK